MHPIESLRVDGEHAELSTFAVPDMSLSSAQSSMCAHHFIIGIWAGEMTELLAPDYAALVRELKADDRKMGGPQDALAVAGYPPLDQVIRKSELLDVLGHHLLHEFIRKHSWDGWSPVRYCFDRITRCETDGEIIRLFGVCYSRP